MRRTIALAVLLTAAGCRQEPTFDERYTEAREKITDKAQELDRELGAASPTPQQSGGGETKEGAKR